MFSRDITLATVRIDQLRPTQIAVGYREVKIKRQHWRTLSGDRDEAFIGSHLVPVVIGPDNQAYVVDHHHLAMALIQEGVDGVLTSTLADLSHLSKSSFWTFMDNRGWCHPYNEKGVRGDFSDIPKAITDMKDDPYRSLSGALRRKGAFAKDLTPFSEFIWADFYRERITPKRLNDDFDTALDDAFQLAKTKDAAYLPGWCGED
jgi:hypothetical protein